MAATLRERVGPLLLPAAGWAAAMALIGVFDLDRRMAESFFFDAQSGTWLGERVPWAGEHLHAAGTALVWAVGIAALVVLVVSLWRPRWRPLPAMPHVSAAGPAPWN